MREPIRLHLGGVERRDGWKIVNIKPGPNVDIVGDIANLSAFEADSIDEVYASHVIEHLEMTTFGQAMTGICRVLKPGGKFMVAVPDLGLLATMLNDPLISPLGVWEVTRRIYGGNLDEHDRHGCGFTAETLEIALAQSGFTDIRRVDSFGLFRDASETTLLGYRISLNMEATKPEA